MKLFKEIFGFVEFEIIGGLYVNFLNDCMKNDIPIYKLKANSLGLTAVVPLRYYKKLHKIARRSRCVLKVKNKHGLYFWLWPYRHRLGIAIGALLLFLSLVIFPQMVWTVQFHNFTSEEQMFLRAQLYEANIQEGAIVNTHDLKTVQYDLFLENDAYSWIKLNFVKGKLIVEKVDAVPVPETQPEEPAAIVALCDGIIQRLEVEGGFIEKSEGQSVSEGDVIVSALIIGKYDKLHTERAIAKVYASVQKTYEITQPLQIKTQLPNMQTYKEQSLLLFGAELSLLNFNKQGENTALTITYKPLTIFGLPLPATIKMQTHRQIEDEIVNYTNEQAVDIARDKILTQLANDLPECEITSANESVQIDEKSITMRIEFEAVANIAKIEEGWNK